jgi:LmbE family N-acetylglucosaminyl deacetylase
MFKLSFDKTNDVPCRLLCLGAHGDDIEIGCGGTILRFLKELKYVEVYWVVFGANGQRRVEAKKSSKLFLENAKKKEIIIKAFRDGFFPYTGAKIKEYFEFLKKSVSPDLIFTHYRNDLHQDHRLISELTWNTFRNHLILEYEILKYDGDLGSPNLFVHLDKRICQRKIEYIRNCFKSQWNRNWFTDDAFLSMLRVRGVESNAPEKYSEAFYCRKIVF